jgi:hypothetical protein
MDDTRVTVRKHVVDDVFAHSLDERVSIPSVERFWAFLGGLLDAVSAPGATP